MPTGHDPGNRDDATDSGTSIDLGSSSEWVDGSSIDWQGFASYLATILVLIVANTYARFVSGIFELPRRVLAWLGATASTLTEFVVGFWPGVFGASFTGAAGSLSEIGALSFIAAVIFVIVWFLVLNELRGVL